MWDFPNSATAQINQLFEIKWCQINISEAMVFELFHSELPLIKTYKTTVFPKGHGQM